MWKISEINNETHKLTLINHEGKILDVQVPKEHSHSIELKQSYISARIKKHEKSLKRLLLGKLLLSAVIIIGSLLKSHGLS